MIDEVIKVPTVATVSCAAYRERIHRLEAERDQLSHRCDKLREALRQIAALDYRTAATTGAACVAVRIARAALAEGGQDE
jgi:uncharacterized protein (UPF0335 family)